jgi:hypothetical protein
MVLVHLVYQKLQFGNLLGTIIGNYTRFAAGGFIFISGMSIGIIFLPRALDPTRRTRTYVSLWRRSVYILGWQYVAAAGLLAMDCCFGNFTSQASALSIFRDIFLLRQGGDLLPFYIVMIALSPFLLEIVRHSGGWIVLAILSLAGFIWGLQHPWTFALAGHDKFPPILWQALFVSGLLFAYFFPKYDALRRSRKLLIAIAAWIVFGLLFVSEFSSDFGWRHLNLHMAFAKVPLSDGEALRYLSMIVGIVTATDILWPLIAPTGASAFVQTLGRKSLPVYVAHLFVVNIVCYLGNDVWWWMGRWEILLAVASVLFLWFFALMLDIWGTPRPQRQPAWLVSGAAQN